MPYKSTRTGQRNARVKDQCLYRVVMLHQLPANMLLVSIALHCQQLMKRALVNAYAIASSTLGCLTCTSVVHARVGLVETGGFRPKLTIVLSQSVLTRCGDLEC